MPAPVIVLDASVGVKWFRDEAGSEAAHDLLARHVDGDVVLAVDSLFVHEVLAVSSRDGHAEDVERVWRDLRALDLAVVPLGDALVSAAASQRAALGCSLYDAFSAGLASLLGAPLCSADERAHGRYPDVQLVG